MAGQAGLDEVAARPQRADRLTLAGLITLTALAWLYLIRLDSPTHMVTSAMTMPEMHRWALTDVALLGMMWVVMMVAMMLPSTTPMILLFVSLTRRRSERGVPYASTTVFVLGYLAVWTGFALFAAGAQAGLHAASVLSSSMASASPTFSGLLLIAAGGYQWAPVKGVCLTHCRSPLGFFTSHWREGKGGAFRMGFLHGLYCLGCCGFLMALLFVAGVMNLTWIALLAGLVLIERTLPAGRIVGRVAGIGLVCWGVWLISQA